MPRPNTNQYEDIAGTGLTLITTEKGAFFLIDTADRAVAERHCWSLHEHGYARAVTRDAAGRSRTVYLHRLLCRCTAEQPHVDHVSGQQFDCRSENLRRCNRKQNMRNAKVRADNRTGLKGVGLHAQTGKYRARVRADGVVCDLGLFFSPEAASQAAAAARESIHGEFCRHE